MAEFFTTDVREPVAHSSPHGRVTVKLRIEAGPRLQAGSRIQAGGGGLDAGTDVPLGSMSAVLNSIKKRSYTFVTILGSVSGSIGSSSLKSNLTG